jgi:hypothetical protein
MTNKWDAVPFERAHEDLFFQPEYDVTFHNYSGGSYDPDTGRVTGETRSQVGSENVEITTPSIDDNIRIDGTSFSWDLTIRFPEEDDIISELVPLGVDNERPTEVEISEPVDGTDTFELLGYAFEKGSGMIQCKLTEQ